jgi:hypothetical protein
MYRIQKSENIQGQLKEILYEGNHTWTTEYQNRKVYETQEEATTELYEFGGEVVTD